MIVLVLVAVLVILAVFPSAETRDKMRTLDRIWAAVEDTEPKP